MHGWEIFGGRLSNFFKAESSSMGSDWLTQWNGNENSHELNKTKLRQSLFHHFKVVKESF